MSAGRALHRGSDLRSLIDPQTVAVAGASETAGSFGQRTLVNLANFKGKVSGVNPKYDETVGFRLNQVRVRHQKGHRISLKSQKITYDI